MINKKLLVLAILLVSLLTVSAVSAADKATNDVISAEETTDEVVIVEDNQEILRGNNDVGTFDELANEINATGEGGVLNLTKDYQYVSGSNKGIQINKTITIDGKGHTLDGNKLSRIFKVNSENVTLKDMTFINGYVYYEGGAVYWSGVNGVLSNCSFINSSSEHLYGSSRGGAVYWSGANGVLSNCNFINSSADYGGAVNLFAANCIMSGCNFVNSHANSGGAVSWGNTNGRLFNCNFVNCSADSEGGAVHGPATNGRLFNCNFVNCSARIGGGFYSWSNNVSVYNCNFMNSSFILIGENNLLHNSSFVNCHDKSYGAVSLNGISDTLFNCNFVNTQVHFAANDGVLYNCNFVNCSKDVDGAVYWSADNGILYNCSFIDCSALRSPKSNGGAVSWSGVNGTLYDCTFVNCNAPGCGGAVYWSSFGGTLYGCTFLYCHARGDGGAVYCNEENAVLKDCIFINCSAANGITYGPDCRGGAIYWHYSNGVLKGCVFINCSANHYAYPRNSYGGGVYFYYDNVSIVESNFINCHSGKYGGGIYFNGKNSSIVNTIFKDNIAVNGSDWYSVEPAHVINQSSIATIIIASNVETSYNSNKNLVATLKDENGRVIKGAQVKMVLDAVTKTATTDNNGKVSFSIKSIPPNIYTAIIVFMGDSIYEASYTTAKVTINKAGTTLTVNDATVTLKDINGNLIGGVKIKVKINNVNSILTTDKSGKAIIYTADLKPDTYIANIAFAGNNMYLPSNVTAKIVVSKINSVLFVDDITTVYNSGKNLIAILKDSNNNAIGGAKVTIKLGDVTKILTTYSNGQVSLSLENIVPNDYIATIIFAGNYIYNPSSTTAKVIINKLNTSLSANNITCYYNSGEKLVVTLTDVNGKVISGAKVTVKLGGSTGTLTTDANGQALFSTDNLNPNNYTARITFDGDNIYKNSATSAKVVVLKKEQSKIFLRNALYFVTQTKMVQVTLWDENNHPLANKTVYIRVYDSVWKGVTDKNGDAFIRVGIGFGVHDATVSFDGDDRYSGSERSGYIRVIKETPSVMVRGADSQFKVKDLIKIVKVHLRDRYNKPLPAGSKIALKLNGQTYIGFTDEEGVARIGINIKTIGTFDAKAIYGGNSAYNAVTRDIKISIKWR